MKNVSEVIAASSLGPYKARLDQMGVSGNLQQTALDAVVGRHIPPLETKLSKQAGEIFRAAVDAGVDPIRTLTQIAPVVDGTKPTSPSGTKSEGRGRKRNKIIVSEGTKAPFEHLVNLTERKQGKVGVVFETPKFR